MKIILIFIFIFSCKSYQKTVEKKEERIIFITNAEEADSENLKLIHQKFDKYQKEFPNVTNIVPRDLAGMEDYLIVDVREEEEQNVSMIKGAITEKNFKKNRHLYKDKKVISYCTIGYRSGIFAKEFQEKGYDTFNLKGGVLLWSHEDKVFIKDNKETKKVHVYGKEWNLAKSGYETTYFD